MGSRVPTTRRSALRKLEGEIQQFSKVPRETLQRRWTELYGTTCPAQMSRTLLVRALAYRLQEKVLGGLDSKTRRQLDRVAGDLAMGRPVSRAGPKIKPGTRLLRDWHGATHEVIVLDKGVRYRNKTWPSLSAVARQITGAQWSGPRFFGLKEKA